MAREVTVDEYRDLVGKEIGVSDWMLIDQARIDRFAEVTEDWQFIHTDPVRAGKTPFGGTIAHGFLTLSLLSPMSYAAIPPIRGSAMGVNYGMNGLRFLAPVHSGKRVRARFTLKEFAERSPGMWQSTIDLIVEIEDEERPALVAEWLILSAVDGGG